MSVARVPGRVWAITDIGENVVRTVSNVVRISVFIEVDFWNKEEERQLFFYYGMLMYIAGYLV